MRRLLVIGAFASWMCSVSVVYGIEGSSPEANFLSFDQQVKIAPMITHRTPPLASVNFAVAIAAWVPPEIQLESFPPEVKAIAPQLRGFGYIVVEELIAIADQHSRKIVFVLPRWNN